MSYFFSQLIYCIFYSIFEVLNFSFFCISMISALFLGYKAFSIFIYFFSFYMNDNIAVNRKEKFCAIALFSEGFGFSAVHLFAW